MPLQIMNFVNFTYGLTLANLETISVHWEVTIAPVGQKEELTMRSSCHIAYDHKHGHYEIAPITNLFCSETRAERQYLIALYTNSNKAPFIVVLAEIVTPSWVTPKTNLMP